MSKDQALRLALEALLEYQDHLRGQAITAIKQALAQPEPEPVAWTDIDFTNIYISEMVAKEKSADVPLYTSPPKREPLTGHQLVQLWKDVNGDDSGGADRFARAIEAAHGIKGEA